MTGSRAAPDAHNPSEREARRPGRLPFLSSAAHGQYLPCAPVPLFHCPGGGGEGGGGVPAPGAGGDGESGVVLGRVSGRYLYAAAGIRQGCRMVPQGPGDAAGAPFAHNGTNPPKRKKLRTRPAGTNLHPKNQPHPGIRSFEERKGVRGREDPLFFPEKGSSLPRGPRSPRDLANTCQRCYNTGSGKRLPKRMRKGISSC